MYHIDFQRSHEAGVYLPSTDSIYITSNYVSPANPINITVVDSSDYTVKAENRYSGLYTPNGGTAYNSTHLLFADSGSEMQPSTLTLLEPGKNVSTVILSSFHGRNFSSINDVRVNYTSWGGDGSIWFTDDQYAALQGRRPPPVIPVQVYRFEPGTGRIQAVADGFVEPNGIEFSPDLQTVYVTDSGYVLAPTDLNGTRPSTVYAFDVASTGAALVNRRVLAYSARPFPDGIHVDSAGNIWTTYGTGVAVWDPTGVLMGEMRVDTAVNNFMFVPEGVLLFASTKLWLVLCDVRAKPLFGGGW